MLGIIFIVLVFLLLPALIVGFASDSMTLAAIIYVILIVTICPVNTTHVDTGTYEIENIEDMGDYYSIIYIDNGTMRSETIRDDDIDISTTSDGNSTMYLEKKYYSSLTGIIYLQEQAHIRIGN